MHEHMMHDHMTHPALVERNECVHLLRQLGYNYTHIAKLMGVTKERIRQIAAKKERVQEWHLHNSQERIDYHDFIMEVAKYPDPRGYALRAACMLLRALWDRNDEMETDNMTGYEQDDEIPYDEVMTLHKDVTALAHKLAAQLANEPAWTAFLAQLSVFRLTASITDDLQESVISELRIFLADLEKNGFNGKPS